MGWLRLVGSLKLQVSFAKEPYKRDYILQKRRIILGSLLIVPTPYQTFVRFLQTVLQWYMSNISRQRVVIFQQTTLHGFLTKFV